LPLNQARRELVSCVMVVSDILAVRINLRLAHGVMWVRRWPAKLLGAPDRGGFYVRPEEPVRG
jgi:hypothetical protein